MPHSVSTMLLNCVSQFPLTSFLSFNKYPINKLLEIDHLG